MHNSGRVALGGLLCALSAAVMIASLFPAVEYIAPALAGAVLLPLTIEVNKWWGLGAYAAVALLVLILPAGLEAKALFIVFFGYYPIIKVWIERLRKVWLRWAAKLALFNVTMVAAYWVMLSFLGLGTDAFEFFGVSLPWVFWAGGNALFVLYDIALTRVAVLYQCKLHPVFMRIFHG